jgi:hypothetical protein
MLALHMSDLPNSSKRILAALIDRANPSTGLCIYAYEDLMARTGLPRRTFFDGLKVISDRGLMETYKHNGTMRYALNWDRIRALDTLADSATDRTSEADRTDAVSATERTEKCEPPHSKVRTTAPESATDRTKSTSQDAVKDSSANDLGASEGVPNLKETYKKPKRNLKQSAPTALTIREGANRFDEFWALYPRKKDKGDAEKAFNQALKQKKATAKELIDGARKYAASVKDTETKFIKYPARWLRAEAWKDEPDNWRTQNNGSGGLNSVFRQAFGDDFVDEVLYPDNGASHDDGIVEGEFEEVQREAL